MVAATKFPAHKWMLFESHFVREMKHEAFSMAKTNQHQTPAATATSRPSDPKRGFFCPFFNIQKNYSYKYLAENFSHLMNANTIKIVSST